MPVTKNLITDIGKSNANRLVNPWESITVTAKSIGNFLVRTSRRIREQRFVKHYLLAQTTTADAELEAVLNKQIFQESVSSLPPGVNTELPYEDAISQWGDDLAQFGEGDH